MSPVKDRCGIYQSVLKSRYERSNENALKKAGGAQRNKLAATAAEVAVQVAANQGRELGLTVAGLIQRTLEDTSKWLERIEASTRNGTLPASELRHLVVAWRTVIETGRQAFNLDRPACGN